MASGGDGGSTNHGAMLTGFQHGLVVFHVQIFALLALEKLIDIGHDRRNLADDENISAETEYLLRDVAIDSIHKGNHGNYRSYTDHYPQ